MQEGTKKKFDDGRVYELWEEFPTLALASKKKTGLLRTMWATHAIITKSPRPEDKKPFRLWTHIDSKTMWERQVKSGVLNEIDKELRPLIKDLNANGIWTIESCSGHGKEPARLWVLRENFSLPLFLKIVKKHGMKNIHRRSMYSDSNRNTLYFTFDLPGKVTYKQDKKRVIRPRKKTRKQQIGSLPPGW